MSAEPIPTNSGQQDGHHWVDGRWTSCCETGETDCPCTCHETSPGRTDRP